MPSALPYPHFPTIVPSGRSMVDMYCDYYGFREKPFNITPDPGFIFLSAQHREAFAHLLYGIDSHIGFIVLTGEVGTGKTTILRTLLGQFDRDKYRTALIFNPCLSSLALLQAINREYGLADDGDPSSLLQVLNRFLLDENAAGRTVILVVDEAQNLDPAVLEQVRLISNLETERDKLIQIVLAGQPELKELLRRRELRQLGQRVAVSYHLGPMDPGDTADYIAHRVTVAGRRGENPFSPGAVRRIYRFSGGLPRLINLACDRALLLGYTGGNAVITSSMADTAAADLRQGPGKRSLARWLSAAALAIGSITLAAALYRHTATSSPPPAITAEPAAPAFVTIVHGELAAVPEEASLRNAFAPLAERLRARPLPPSFGSAAPPGIARQLGLETLRYGGDLAALVRLDTTALLQLSLPGVDGKRFVALTGTAGDRLMVVPPIGGRSIVTVADLEPFWSGTGYLFWKNYLDIPPGLNAGSTGEKVSRLQGLLRGAGVYAGKLSGRFDAATREAVKTFQASRGLTADGKPGAETLFHLYRTSNAITSPRLSTESGP